MSKVIKITDATDLVPSDQYPYGKWDFSHFNPIQSKLIEIYQKDCNVVIASATASGKAQPLDAQILTPSGFVEMGDVEVGQEIVSSSGELTHITGVYPQGTKSIYRVIFSDGSSTTCCENHLWAVKVDNQFWWSVQSLKEIKSKTNFRLLKIPLATPHEIFPLKSYKENRYFESIELIGKAECQCISVAADDHLYITNDYILTHNTISSELFLAYEIRKNKGKGIYVGPLKSLAKEKQEDWTLPTHHFSDLKTFIATGDYRFTAKRLKEMEESSLIVMTPEMLSSRARNYKSEKSQFLQDTNVIVWDEFHLIGVPKRGDHCEVALMKLLEINPKIRMVALSATMPNVDEICGWLAEVTDRDTYYLESTYRPCPLNIHYETYYDGDRDYDSKELSKIGTACAIVEHYPDDKFLVFVHTKRTGQKMVEALERYGIGAEFHNADLVLKKRLDLEDRFKNDKNFRVLVATSTVAWGCNLPARRVVITGVHRGLQEVENYDFGQMCGRAGRPKYDPRGDAYILVPESEKDHWIRKLKKPTLIHSTLLEYVGKETDPHYKTLAFHIVAEIHQGNVKTKEAFHKWFKNSLAYYQEQFFDDQVIDNTLSLLLECKAIIVRDNEYECTSVGKIASMFYYSPFDVGDLKKNFVNLFETNKDQDDFAVSISLANIDTHRWGIVNKWEKEVISSYASKVERMFGVTKFTDSVLKIGCVYYHMLKGKHDIPILQAITGTLLADMDRTIQVLNAIDSMSAKWDRTNWFKNLSLRIRYGVEPDLVELCQIPNVGGARAKKLKAAKIKSVEEFASYDINTLAKIMKCSLKLVNEAMKGAKDIILKESME